MDAKKQVRVWLTLHNTKMTELADKMSKLSDKKYTDASLYAKLNRGTLSFNEMELIAKILGYRIEFIEE